MLVNNEFRQAAECTVFVQALMSLFVLASKDGWVNIMYSGLDAVGVDLQVCTLHYKTDISLERFVYLQLYKTTASRSGRIGLRLLA